MFPVLAKDSATPAKATKGDLTNGSDWTETDVLIFQGENPVAFDNDLIGRLLVKLPEAREKGYYSFEVTFELDENGLLDVAVKNLKNDEIWKTEVVCDVRASQKQIDESARALQGAMAGAPKADTAVGPLPASGAVDYLDLPKPPSRPARPAAPELVPPPDQTPPDFKAVARRSYKMLGQLSEAEGAELRAAYLAFVAAVERDADDVEDLGDALDDVFHQFRKR